MAAKVRLQGTATRTALAALLALGAVAPAVGDTIRQLVITPERTVSVLLDLQGERRLEGEKAIKGMQLPAFVQEAVFAQGCAILRENAELLVEVVDASAPQKKGKPGYLLLQVKQATFADGRMREWEGGFLCVSGTDKSDKGKALFGMKSRKGGKAEIERGEVLELPLVPDPAGPPAECLAEPKEEEGEPPEPKPQVIKLMQSACELPDEAAGEETSLDEKDDDRKKRKKNDDG